MATIAYARKLLKTLWCLLGVAAFFFLIARSVLLIIYMSMPIEVSYELLPDEVATYAADGKLPSGVVKQYDGEFLVKCSNMRDPATIGARNSYALGLGIMCVLLLVSTLTGGAYWSWRIYCAFEPDALRAWYAKETNANAYCVERRSRRSLVRASTLTSVSDALPSKAAPAAPAPAFGGGATSAAITEIAVASTVDKRGTDSEDSTAGLGAARGADRV